MAVEGVNRDYISIITNTDSVNQGKFQHFSKRFLFKYIFCCYKDCFIIKNFLVNVFTQLLIYFDLSQENHYLFMFFTNMRNTETEQLKLNELLKLDSALFLTGILLLTAILIIIHNFWNNCSFLIHTFLPSFFFVLKFLILNHKINLKSRTNHLFQTNLLPITSFSNPNSTFNWGSLIFMNLNY